LVHWLYAPEQDSLRRAFTVWLKKVLLPARLPGVDVPEMADLNEVNIMLAERVKEWTQQWKAEGLKEGFKEGIEKGIAEGIEQGIEQGLEKGIEKGRTEGEARLLARLLENKFGALNELTRHRLEAADDEQLLRWGERVLVADSLDGVFDDREA
jgi:flagellar biosynthesis/type III secretory pathway protein FliH